MFGNVRVGIAEVWDTIDNRIWSITNPATGTDWTVNGEYITVVPNASETATLTTRNTLTGACGYIGTNTRTKQVILDFRIQFANIANIDNAEFVIGFSDTNSGGRSTENDFIGWGLTSDALVPLTVEGGAATAGSDVSVTETDFNRLTIVLDGTDAHFFVNGTYKATVDCSALTSVMYIKCYVDTDGVGAATVNIGELLYDPSATAADYNVYGVPPTHWGKKATDFEFPMFFMSKFDMLTPVTGRTAAQVSCAYYKDGDSSETAYTMTGNLTEVDNGHYTVNIGAGEFTDSNSFYTVIVRDTLNVFADYVFKVHVTDMTMDELMDFFGTGPSSTYNFYNIYNQQKQEFNKLKKENDDLRSIIQKTLNNQSRMSKRIKKV